MALMPLPKCPVHKTEMSETERRLPKEQMYFLCPMWGCVQRYREQDGHFTTASLPAKKAEDEQ